MPPARPDVLRPIALPATMVVSLFIDEKSGAATVLGYWCLLYGVANLVLFILIYQPLVRFVDRRMTGAPSFS
jgi:hypothetical protein